MYKILMIVNPKAGKGKITKYIEKIKENIEQQKYSLDIEYTTLEKNATEIVKGYRSYFDIVLVCGGDGTLNETIEGLVYLNKKAFVGFIPVGTTNDFARSLGASFDMLHLSENINLYDSKKIDMGKCNGKVFNYIISFGMFARTSYRTNRFLKNKLGRIAYVFNALGEIIFHKKYKLRISTDTREIKGTFVYGSISNSKFVGGFPVFKNKDIILDDGEFDILLVKDIKNIFTKLKILVNVLRGKLNDPNVYYLKSKHVEIEVDEELDEWLEFSRDGEYGGRVKNLNIINLKQYNEYILPIGENFEEDLDDDDLDDDED